MAATKTTFALFYGNRGFFPASLIAEARAELPRVLKQMGHDSIAMEAAATRHGAVETVAEGARFAAFLRENRGEFGGVILCLPNFGDENGAVAALKDAGVPILVQAYPDTLDRMAPEVRRDAFCGKMSIMDVFCQYGVQFTALKPHVAAPAEPRLPRKRRALRPGLPGGERAVRACGRRDRRPHHRRSRRCASTRWRCSATASRWRRSTSPTCCADAQPRCRRATAFRDKAGAARSGYTSWDGVPEGAFENIVRLGVVLDTIVAEYGLHAIALRCWIELQQQLGISPCVLLGEMNDRGDRRRLRGRRRKRGDHARAATGLGRAGHLPGLEQQLRRRGGQVHPLPLRPRARRR